ncbi:DUF5999 family protein [Streptomyces sp. CAU 1734]|uniref:DUF5999 family protein n=1 Tax=Streptomyces sp. CAU 1734 TaxID=3140360 RepID=UPI003260137D
MCGHQPRCPAADAPDRGAAQTVAAQESQGWAVRCNGVICFDDGGCVLPNGPAEGALRVPPRSVAAV